MLIEDLLPGQSVTLSVNFQGKQLEFETTVQRSYEKKQYILLAPILVNEKAISFRGNDINVNLIITPGNNKPQVFKNVTLLLQKKTDGSLCYQATAPTESVPYNRRNNFRCFVGLPSSVRGDANRIAHDTIIRDVSYTGFSVVCDAETNFDPTHILHTVLRDRIDELQENYTFHLYGTIVRTQELENGKILYGCRLAEQVPGLDKYIMTKERIRLYKTHGKSLKTHRGAY